MRSVLITGGAGFIGSHLAEAVLAAGDTVVAVDDLSTGSFRNVDHLNGGGFELVVASVDDPATMEGLVRSADLVYHLAAAVGVKLIVSDPVRTIETNIRGTEVVLRLANKWRRPVVLASTSEVYGKSERVPYAEEHDMVLGPTSHSRWAYAASKAIDEFLAVAYFRRDGLPVVIARLFNTVGPRQTGRYGMVLPTFIRQALRGEPITVYGDGRQSRSFTYVGDAVRALLELPRHPSAFGEVFNVGGGREVTILELARLVRERTESGSEIVMVPYDQAYAPGFEDMVRRVPDVSKLQRVTGFAPRVSLEETIDRVAEHCRQNPDFV
jgi:UDP-glucose 4-epimerase